MMLDVVHQFALAQHRFCAGHGLGEFLHHVDDDACQGFNMHGFSFDGRAAARGTDAVLLLPTCWACHRAITKTEQRRGEFVTAVENGNTIWRHAAC